jgi:hypothetical protein
VAALGERGHAVNDRAHEADPPELRRQLTTLTISAKPRLGARDVASAKSPYPIDERRRGVLLVSSSVYGERVGHQCHREGASHCAESRARGGGNGLRARTEGGLIIEAETSGEAYLIRLEDMSRRQPIREFSTEEVTRMSRGED